MNQRPSLMPVRLPNGAEIQVEIRGSGEGDVGGLQQIKEALPLDALRDTVSGLAEFVNGAVKGLQPDKVSVEFGLELGYQPGKLVAFLVNGSAKGSLKIGLEWMPKA